MRTNLKAGAKISPEEVNELLSRTGAKRIQSEYRKGSNGHTITRQFSGFVFLRGVSEEQYEIILTPNF